MTSDRRLYAGFQQPGAGQEGAQRSPLCRTEESTEPAGTSQGLRRQQRLGLNAIQVGGNGALATEVTGNDWFRSTTSGDEAFPFQRAPASQNRLARGCNRLGPAPRPIFDSQKSLNVTLRLLQLQAA